jgi:hypothetical protein
MKISLLTIAVSALLLGAPLTLYREWIVQTAEKWGSALAR